MDALLNNAKIAQTSLSSKSEEEINLCLKKIKKALLAKQEYIINENKKDIEAAQKANLNAAMIERLTLNEKRVLDLAESIENIISLPFYVGEVIESFTRPNGIKINKIRTPFGVIAVIFESRPNVCVDIACLALKTANACVLKGGKEAINTNKALVNIMQDAIKKIVDKNVITLIESTDRSATDELITKKQYIDLLIPRGSKGLINYVVANAKIPYIETGAGNCHLFIDESASLDMALKIAVNAKHQRPSVCNAIENILVHKNCADKFLPLLYKKFSSLNIEMRGDEKTLQIIPINKATDEDFFTEYNDYIVSIKIVDSLDEAINHINTHSSKHSESIITENNINAVKFLNLIDSACVYHNASTRFTDGGEFGFGAEIGISTAKLHARGPMGLKEITTYKYIITGNGQERK